MSIRFVDCADQNTPVGAFAKISSSAKLNSEPGHWSKVGDEAIVGRNSPLGSWSSVGHFAKVGDNVEFGQWASVGMCAVVDSGVKLSSHRYVPSGHRLRRNGSLDRLGGFSPEDVAIFRLYDSFMGRNGPSCMSTEEAAWRDETRARQAEAFLELLPAFLERRKVFRTERPSLLQRLLPALYPPGNSVPPSPR